MPSIQVDLGDVIRATSPEAFKNGRYNMASVMHSTMNENFVPRKFGDLREKSQIAEDGSTITWNMIYAKRMYYGLDSWNWTTVGTGGRWDERAKGLYMDRYKQAFIEGAGL